jgi:outer membrane receptor for ferrienterochelin and colicin
MIPPRRRFRGRCPQPARPVPTPLLAFLVAGLLGAANPALAQTGTIHGNVTDPDGTPLAGVSVMVLGLQTGAITNASGEFTIGHLPVKSYTVRAVIIGRARTDRFVNVDANRTTRVDFTLSGRVVQVPGVEVRPSLQSRISKKAEARQVVTAEDLHSLPVQNLMEAIALKAGVVNQGGALHFRGGRADEVLTIVNGIPSRNPLSAEGVDLGLLAVSTTDEVMGGLDAQYGNALSGVINLTTREGDDHLKGEVRYFTDRYGESDKAFNNYERLSLGVGGPFLFRKTNYFISMEGTFTDTFLKNVSEQKEHRLLDFIRLGNRQSNQTKISTKLTYKVTPNAKLNTELILNRSSRSQFHNRWNRKGFVQVTYDSTAPTDGTIATRYGTWAYYQVDPSFLPSNTAQHLPVTDEDYSSLALTWRQTLAPGTIYNLRASRQEWQTTEDVLGRQVWEYQQSPANYYDPLNRIEGPYYVTNGDFPHYDRRNTVTYTVNGDLVKKAGAHDLMAGLDMSYNSLSYLDTDYPNLLGPSGAYGSNRDDFEYYNPEGSAFVQDRWEYEGMVLNAGIRYDAFSIGDQIPSAEVTHRVKTQWSPRVGIAYPISDRDVMSFHYGRLFQVPERLNIYQGRNISAQVRGNPNLEPQTTISYQLGLQHLFSKEIYGQFGVYFKDIFGLLTTVPRQDPGFAETVETYENGDYASSRGFEFTVVKKHSHGFSGELNYTYSNSSGTASDPNRALANSGNLRDQYKPTSEQPLDWDQRHSFSAALHLGDESDWAASFIYQFGTGTPYTPLQRQQRRQDPALENSRRLPSTSTLSCQAERFFRVWGQRVTFYLQGTNLLDTKDIAVLQPRLWPDNPAVNSHSYQVYYTETGRAGGAFLVPDQNGDGREDWYPVNDPRVFQPGRVLRTGLGIQF